jgi:hypothetical protein
MVGKKENPFSLGQNAPEERTVERKVKFMSLRGVNVDLSRNQEKVVQLQGREK